MLKAIAIVRTKSDTAWLSWPTKHSSQAARATPLQETPIVRTRLLGGDPFDLWM